MQELTKLGKHFLSSLLIILIGLIIISIFSYLDILGERLISIGQFAIIFIAVFVGSFKQGKYGEKKGYIEIFKIGILFILFMLILNLILYNSFTLKNWIYYFLIVLVSIISGMVGVTKRIEKK